MLIAQPVQMPQSPKIRRICANMWANNNAQKPVVKYFAAAGGSTPPPNKPSNLNKVLTKSELARIYQQCKGNNIIKRFTSFLNHNFKA